MKIIVKENYEKMSTAAAEIVAQKIKENTSIVLGLATGSTPLGLYKILAKMCQKGELDFSKVTTFNLDEYLGLDDPPSLKASAGQRKNPQSYYFFMKKNLFSRININPSNTFFPVAGGKLDEQYEEKIKEKGRIDLQILGIGGNGHVGFNEPGSSFDSKTRIVDLAGKTIKDNSRFFKNIDEVPKKAGTMGISTIMSAREIILLASGKNKKEIVLQAFTGPITEKVPASILQKHKNVTVFLDKEAGELLK